MECKDVDSHKPSHSMQRKYTPGISTGVPSLSADGKGGNSISISELISRQREISQSQSSRTKLRVHSHSRPRLRQLMSTDSVYAGELLRTKLLEVPFAFMVNKTYAAKKHVSQDSLVKNIGEKSADGEKLACQMDHAGQLIVSPAFFSPKIRNIPPSKRFSVPVRNLRTDIKTIKRSQFAYFPEASHVVKHEQPVNKTSKPELKLTKPAEPQLIRKPAYLSVPETYSEYDSEDSLGRDDEKDKTGTERSYRLLQHVDDLENVLTEEVDCKTKSLKVAESSASHLIKDVKPHRRTTDIAFENRTSTPRLTTGSVNTIHTKRQNKNRNPLTLSKKNQNSTEKHYFSSSNHSLFEYPDHNAIGDCLDKYKIASDLTITCGFPNGECNRKHCTDNNAKLSKQFSYSPISSKIQLHSNVKIREDKNITVNISPRNLGRNVRHSLRLKQSKLKNVCNDHTNCSNHVPATVVTVDYKKDDDFKEFVPNHLMEKTEKDFEEVSFQPLEVNISLRKCETQCKPGNQNKCYEIPHARTSKSAQTASTRITSVPKKNECIASEVMKTKIKEFGPSKGIPCERILKFQNKRENSKEDLNYKKCESTMNLLCHDSTKNEQKNLPPSEEIFQEFTIHEKLPKKPNTGYQSSTLSKTKSNLHLHSRISSEPKGRSQPPFADSTKTRSFSSLSNSRQTGPAAQKYENSKLKLFGEYFRKENATPTKTKGANLPISRKTRAMKSGSSAVKTRAIKSASSAVKKRTGCLHSQNPESKTETPLTKEFKAVQTKMAALGIDVGRNALERALYPSYGKLLYKHVAGYLPSDPCYGLLPHYKHWLSDEYKELKKIQRKLANDDRLRQKKSQTTQQVKTFLE